jgi:putative redox protein
MMAEQLEVTVNLTNQKVQFTGVLRSNPAITCDYNPPLGDGQGYTGLELLLMSLAACSGTTIVALLRKMAKNISGFQVNAKGIRRDVHPTSFQKIFLEFILNSKDTGDSDLQKSIQLAEETYCPVWAMLKNNVEIISEYRIIREVGDRQEMSTAIKTQTTKLDLSVEDLARCVASLDEEVFLEKFNGWSPRDILAHLIGWNRCIIEGCKQIKKRELPFYDIDPGENYSKVNAGLVRSYPSRDKQELLDELQTSARELKHFLQSQNHNEWARDYGVRHRGSTITIRNTVDDLIADYAHHKEQIEEWVKDRQNQKG